MLGKSLYAQCAECECGNTRASLQRFKSFFAFAPNWNKLINYFEKIWIYSDALLFLKNYQSREIKQKDGSRLYKRMVGLSIYSLNWWWPPSWWFEILPNERCNSNRKRRKRRRSPILFELPGTISQRIPRRCWSLLLDRSTTCRRKWSRVSSYSASKSCYSWRRYISASH